MRKKGHSDIKGFLSKQWDFFFIPSYYLEHFEFIIYVYVYMLPRSTKDLRRKLLGMDIIASESIVYAFLH